MSFAARVLAGMGPGFRRRSGPLLEPTVDALASAAEPLDALVVGDGTRPPWTDAFDLERTAFPAWVGQASGTPVPGSLSLPAQRAYVRDRPAQRRGTVGALVATVQQTLRGSRRVVLVERDGGPYRLRVQVYASEVTDVEQVRAAALTQKPVGLVLTVEVLSGASVAHMRDFHGPSVADYAARFATVGQARDHVPEGV